MVNLIIDKSRPKFHLQEFNKYLINSLEVILPLNAKFCISHMPSENHKGIQAVDIFTYGFHRKYERRDTEWYDVFKKKVLIECNYQI